MTDEKFLIPREAGVILHMSARSVRNLCDLGQITHEVYEDSAGRRRFYISETVVHAYRDRHVIRSRKKETAIPHISTNKAHP